MVLSEFFKRSCYDLPGPQVFHTADYMQLLSENISISYWAQIQYHNDCHNGNVNMIVLKGGYRNFFCQILRPKNELFLRFGPF